MSGEIDLHRVVAEKSPSLADRLPTAAYRFLTKTLHIHEINHGLRRFGTLEGYDFVVAIRDFLDLRVRCSGWDGLDGVTAPIFAANHPLGGLDGIALMSVIGERHPDLAVPVNDFLMNIPNLRSLFVPVNKHGSNRCNYFEINDVFTSGKAVLHFPAGLCSRRRGHLIRDLEWKKTFIAKARMTGRTIVPVFVEGRNSRRFYRIAQLRERSGWRFNIEMILLVDEMFRQRGNEIRIVFGPPVPGEFFDRRVDDRGWAELMRRYVYALGARPRLSFASWVTAMEER